MHVKVMIKLKKLGYVIGKGLDTILVKPYWALHKLKYNINGLRVKRATGDKAVKIATKAILRYLVRYRSDEEGMSIVIADSVSTEYGLTSFSSGGSIGIFKSSYGQGVYRKYIEDNRLMQYDVIDELKQTKGVKVVTIKESDLSSSDYKGFDRAFLVTLDDKIG